MKNLVPLLVYLISSFLPISCSSIKNDEEINFDKKYISFECNNIESKALITTNDNLNDFAVFTYVTFNEAWSSMAMPNYMHNIKVSKNSVSANWDYNPQMFWPDPSKKSFNDDLRRLRNYPNNN